MHAINLAPLAYYGETLVFSTNWSFAVDLPRELFPNEFQVSELAFYIGEWVRLVNATSSRGIFQTASIVIPFTRRRSALE
jgi:hypothetical protein